MDVTFAIYLLLIFISVVFAGVLAWYVRQTLRYQALVTIQMDYRSTRMNYAVSRLWRFYRKECGGNKEQLVEKYEAKYYEERNDIENVQKNNQIKALETTLDNQRRLVIQFYQHLAALYATDILPRDIVFDIWTKETLSIIPYILCPMENKLIKIINAEVEELELSDSDKSEIKLSELDEYSNLYTLYKDSKEYSKLQKDVKRRRKYVNYLS